MRTLANEIWLGVGNNPSSHVDIVSGQGDSKASAKPGWAPGIAMITSQVSPIRLGPDGQLIWVAMVTISTMCDLFCKL